jgi:hypothetical protein
MPIKTFRGKMEDSVPGNRETIRLSTNNGSVGYRIVKFQVMPEDVGSTIDGNIKIYKVSNNPGPSGTVDFSDNTLLAVAHYYNGTYEIDEVVVFDNEIFNQDIYLVYHEAAGTASMNYYIELEQIKLDLNENTVATLKDIRNVASSAI